MTTTTTLQGPAIIVAVARGRAIGRRGELAFHISADLRRFKALTMGHPLVMGRKTFESFPNGPLPGRRNIVVTRNCDYSHPGVETAASLDEALAMAGEGAYVIGGGEIYRQAISRAARLELTEIDADAHDADTFFPAIGPEWECSEEGPWQTDDATGLTYRFVTLVK